MPAKAFTIGEKFGSLKFVRPADPIPTGKGYPKRTSVFLCDCGKEIIAKNESVMSGHTHSCGCSRLKINITHGQCSGGKRSRAYVCWCSMIDRCEREENKSYPRYGGRQITVCERWRKSYANFFEDMGPGKKGWTLERVNNNGHYEPGNVCWATRTHQNRNRSSSLPYTFRGVTATLPELVERFGGLYRRVRWRLLNGWEPEKAFSQPARERKHVE